jgi:hypothetical protein
MKTTGTVFTNGLIGLAAFFATSIPFVAQAGLQVSYTPDGAVCQRMLAGQFIEAGEVCVEVVGDFMTVTYKTSNGWELSEAQLWTGLNLALMPVGKQGNPQIGNFTYKSGDITGTTNYPFYVPLNELSAGSLCDLTGYLAAHAALRKPDGIGGYQTETGWVEGQPINGGSWAMYSSVSFTCPPDPIPEPLPVAEGCETAFAFGDRNGDLILDRDKGDLELDDFLKTKRWGWQLAVRKGDSFTVPIYAAAGKNDISKGTLVGELDVTYKESKEVAVAYRMLSGFSLDETHLYVGTRYLPKVAPGTYGHSGSDSYIVTLKADAPTVYVVAHAVVRGAALEGTCGE